MGMTHFDENGKAIMVDVTEKEDTKREATATGKIIVNQEVYQAIQQGTVRKGDVLGVATTAGIMAAKRTFELIPIFFPLPTAESGLRWSLPNWKSTAIVQ